MRNFHEKLALSTLLTLLTQGACGQVLFRDDFESGGLEQWDVAVPKAQITTTQKYEGERSLRILYEVPAGPPAHRDNNRFVQEDMTDYNLQAFFVNGCFRTEAGNIPTYGRKLLYIWSTNPNEPPTWDIIVSMAGGTSQQPALELAVASNFHPYSNLRVPLHVGRGLVDNDTWHCLELRVRLNSPGQADGVLQLFVDNVLILDMDDLQVRADERPVGRVRVGAQIDRGGDTLPRSENRYWDNVEIGRISVGADPSPPPDVVVE